MLHGGFRVGLDSLDDHRSSGVGMFLQDGCNAVNHPVGQVRGRRRPFLCRRIVHADGVGKRLCVAGCNGDGHFKNGAIKQRLSSLIRGVFA